MAKYYDYDKAMELTRNMEIDFLQIAPKKVNGHDSYICPKCGNGNGSDGDGIALDQSSGTNKYKCFRCGLWGDIFDLWAIHSNTSGNRVYTSLYEHYKIDEMLAAETENEKRSEKIMENKIQTQATIQVQDKLKQNYETNYKRWHQRALESEYFHSRGLSNEIIERFNLGIVDTTVYNSENERYEEWIAAVIPIDNEHYILRNTDQNGTGQKYAKRGKYAPTYNIQCLYTSKQPIFFVEGHFDALSIIEVGGEAIAFGTTSMPNDLRNALKKQKPAQPIIIALDNDQPGIEGAERLEQELTDFDIPFYRITKYDIDNQVKDANEGLVKNRVQFKMLVNEAKKAALDEIQKIEVEDKNTFLGMSELAHLAEFRAAIARDANVQRISTGFKLLDGQLNGGLFCGNLYVIGAMSSLGKSTFALQLVNQAAQNEQDVFFLSMEMPRHELTAKSISYLTARMNTSIDNKVYRANTKTSFEIECGSKYSSYTAGARESIEKALNYYETYAKHITICEGSINTNIDEIRGYVKQHIQYKGTKPLLIVDYLQILPTNDKLTDKQAIDRSILALKQIARDFAIPVVVISSFNRDNYYKPVSMLAFKDSGSVEYTADTLIGLQLCIAENGKANEGTVRNAKRKEPREIALVILKQRNGVTGGKIKYEYHSAINYFKEIEKIEN